MRFIAAGRSHLEKPADVSGSLLLDLTELTAVPNDVSELYLVIPIVAIDGEGYALEDNIVT